MFARPALSLAAIVFGLSVLAVPGTARACFTLDRPVSDEEIDRYTRQVVDRLEELFEAEVLSAGGNLWEMRVTRVHRGRLREGMVLRGRPSTASSCVEPELRPGDRGFVWVSFGPAGPAFVSGFVDERNLASLRRIGALPPD